MTPVRVECGVHFGASVSGCAGASLGFTAVAVALAAMVVLILRAKKGCKDKG